MSLGTGFVDAVALHSAAVETVLAPQLLDYSAVVENSVQHV